MINNSNNNMKIIIKHKIHRDSSNSSIRKKANRIDIFRRIMIILKTAIIAITIITANRRTSNYSQEKQKIEKIKKLKLFRNTIGIMSI